MVIGGYMEAWSLAISLLVTEEWLVFYTTLSLPLFNVVQESI